VKVEVEEEVLVVLRLIQLTKRLMNLRRVQLSPRNSDLTSEQVYILNQITDMIETTSIIRVRSRIMEVRLCHRIPETKCHNLHVPRVLRQSTNHFLDLAQWLALLFAISVWTI
jgi:hypothetical protein